MLELRHAAEGEQVVNRVFRELMRAHVRGSVCVDDPARSHHHLVQKVHPCCGASGLRATSLRTRGRGAQFEVSMGQAVRIRAFIPTSNPPAATSVPAPPTQDETLNGQARNAKPLRLAHLLSSLLGLSTGARDCSRTLEATRRSPRCSIHGLPLAVHTTAHTPVRRPGRRSSDPLWHDHGDLRPISTNFCST